MSQARVEADASFSFLCADVQHVVPPDEGVSVLVLQLSVVVLLCLLQCNVHVPVQAGQHTWKPEATSGQCTSKEEALLNSLIMQQPPPLIPKHKYTLLCNGSFKWCMQLTED